MTKLYKAIDKMDGEMSAFLVMNDGCVITHWFVSDSWEILAAKQREIDGPASSTHGDFENRAINPILIAEW